MIRPANSAGPRLRDASALWLTACGILLVAGGLAPDARAGLRGGIQESATSVTPSPARANRDRSRAYYDGCIVSRLGTRSPSCVYGDRRSSTTVALFGDSHALQYFPALERVAEQRDWRLLVLTKGACPAADVPTYRSRNRRYHQCDAWRRNTLRRLRREKPALVVTSNSNRSAVGTADRQLHGPSRSKALARGYAELVKRLLARGAKVVAIRDGPRPPFDEPPCVARYMQQLRRCAFALDRSHREGDIVEAALRRVRGLKLVDPAGQLCVGNLCPAVIDDILVFRAQGHLTATFSATLGPWLGQRLRGLG